MNRSESLLILVVALACAALALILAASAQAQTTVNFSGFNGAKGFKPEASALAAMALQPIAPAQGFTVVQNFKNANGERPLTPPILAGDGNIYGATSQGGANSNGVIYRLSSQGKLTTFYSFCSQTNCSDGSIPEFGPIQGKDGNLYGTTSNGGAHGLGVLYRLRLSGDLTVMHNFCICNGGWYANSLVEDGDGGFYGTTLEAGAHQFGAIFHLSAKGAFTTLYNFCDSQPSCINAYTNDGEPQPLLLGSDGNVYGITTTGGQSYYQCAPGGCGTVFKITPQGEFSIFYSFCSLPNCADGGGPAWLTRGSDGNFYGTTSMGGSEVADGGTVFQLTPSGVLNSLHSFTWAKDSNSGYAPYDLIQAGTGTLYGITIFGGNKTDGCQNIGCGTVFSVSTSGASFESLHSFGAGDGYAPAGLAQISNHTLIGTASSGGVHRDGVLFELSLN